MSNSPSRAVALMFLLALALPATVFAQTKDTSDVHGVVLDASGQPAAGHPMKITTQQWGEVILKPTESDGTFTVEGLPPGNYELRVFDPGGSTDKPIASKQVTLAAGQKGEIEIRLGSGNPGAAGASKSAAGGPAAGTMLGAIGGNGKAIAIFVVVLAAGVAAFFALRVREKARS